MTSTVKPKQRVLKFVVIVALSLALICIGAYGFFQIKYESHILRSKDPQKIVDAFVEALMNNKLRFAKKLVVPEQQVKINQWEADTNHEAHDCPGDWNFDHLDPIAWGGGGSGVIDDNTVRVNSAYGCYNNGYSISIEDAIVKFDGRHWRITDWDKICESSDKHGSPRICYPEN